MPYQQGGQINDRSYQGQDAGCTRVSQVNQEQQQQQQQNRQRNQQYPQQGKRGCASFGLRNGYDQINTGLHCYRCGERGHYQANGNVELG